MIKSKSRNYVPPDGGWGWAIVFGVALTNIFNQSLLSIFGLLFRDHLESIGQTTVGAALVMNLNSCALNFSGVLIRPLLKQYSSRTVAVTGSLLTGVGLILSAYTTRLSQVCFSYGLLVGTGLGLINPTAFLAINSYFTTRRARAVGLAMAGTGVGQMLMPHVVTWLLEHYGFKGTILIMGGLALNGIVGASLFQPVTKHLNKTAFCENKCLLQGIKSDYNYHTNDEGNSIPTTSIEIETPTSNTWLTRIANAMDLKLLSDLIFINILIGISLIYTATINFSMIFPYFLKETAGLPDNDVALCLSVLAGADLASRLTLPTLMDKFKISCRKLFLTGGFLLIVVRTILTATVHRNSLIWISAIFGYIRASIVINQNLTVSEHLTQDRLAGALGLNMIAKGAFVITVGQLLGWIRDHFHSYVMCLHAQNVLVGIVTVMWSTEIIYRRFK